MKYKFTCPIFDDEIYLIVGNSSEAKKFVKGFEVTDKHNGKCVEIEDVKSETACGFLVWVNRSDNYYTMVHECLHLVNMIFKFHGIPFTSDNDEIIAYYQNYWVRKFWNKMSKEIKK